MRPGTGYIRLTTDQAQVIDRMKRAADEMLGPGAFVDILGSSWMKVTPTEANRTVAWLEAVLTEPKCLESYAIYTKTETKGGIPIISLEYCGWYVTKGKLLRLIKMLKSPDGVTVMNSLNGDVEITPTWIPSRNS